MARGLQDSPVQRAAIFEKRSELAYINLLFFAPIASP
jgi:hypothetical protein